MTAIGGSFELSKSPHTAILTETHNKAQHYASSGSVQMRTRPEIHGHMPTLISNRDKAWSVATCQTLQPNKSRARILVSDVRCTKPVSEIKRESTDKNVRVVSTVSSDTPGSVMLV